MGGGAQQADYGYATAATMHQAATMRSVQQTQDFQIMASRTMQPQGYPGQQATRTFKANEYNDPPVAPYNQPFDLTEPSTLQSFGRTMGPIRDNAFNDRRLPLPKQLPLPTMPRSEGQHPDREHYWRQRGRKSSVAHWGQYEDRWARHMLRTQRPYPNTGQIDTRLYPDKCRAEIPQQLVTPFSSNSQPLAGKSFGVLPYHGLYTFEHLSEEASRSRVPRNGSNVPLPVFSRTLKQPKGVEGPIWEAP